MNENDILLVVITVLKKLFSMGKGPRFNTEVGSK